MVAMAKRLKVFQIVFSDPSKVFYCSGDKVAGKIVVEVNEITRISAMRVIGVGCAKVDYSKGKQRCRQEMDYLKYEEVVQLDDHPAGKRIKQQQQLCIHPSTLEQAVGSRKPPALVRHHGYQ